MTSSRRLPPSVRVGIVAITAVAAFFGFPAPNGHAFYVPNHETITRNALPADQVSEAAMLQILVGPPPGAGVVGSDAFINEDFRHLDNATDPAAICSEAQQAWNTFEPIILSGSQQTGAGLADGPGARAAFGGLLHVQQDFYSHSNWVDLNVDAGTPENLAPTIFPTCDPDAFPADLHTGYYELAPGGNHDDPLSGCPADGPPPGFQECHSTLNKDGPNTMRGSQMVPGMTITKYDLAAQLATTASTALYDQIRGLVASSNGEDAAVALFQADGGEPAGPAISPAIAGLLDPPPTG